ncbi:MAG: nicotinate-nucleotide--dimethylbenzimidazole phosphoribosyltransferase [Chloroflexota bacterium]
MPLLESTIAAIAPLDTAAMLEARLRQDRLTKPLGALGRLEALSIQLAGITGRVKPDLARKAVVVCAADHGVAAQGVSAYPQAVTAQMVLNFLGGGAAINVLARHAGARLVVADVGVAAALPAHPELLSRRIGPGTADFTTGPAMSRSQAETALATGIEIVAAEVGRGLDLVATGEMGIANTTASSALIAVFTGETPETVTGRGTGVTNEVWRHKVDVIRRGLALHAPDPRDPIGVLASLGGFEIGALAGVILGASAHRVPVVLDGFISGAAGVVAAAIQPLVREYCIASHRSVEQGHRAALAWLGLEPLLDLNLRLGEGTGAVLAFPIIEASAKLLAEMATFDGAGVSEATGTPPTAGE